MIAGWNIPGIPPVQIYKTKDSSLCFAGDQLPLQNHLNIHKSCSLLPIKGIFALFSKDFFTHISVPLQHIEIKAWSTENSFQLQGNVLKENPRSLFPLYVWMYSLYTQL